MKISQYCGLAAWTLLNMCIETGNASYASSEVYTKQHRSLVQRQLVTATPLLDPFCVMWHVDLDCRIPKDKSLPSTSTGKFFR
jgi:hypothetical protein